LYFTSGGWVFGPKPGRVLAKFGYVVNPPLDVSRESMMRGIALGLQKQCHFIPPLRVVIERVLELTTGHQAWFDRKLEHIMQLTNYYESTIDIDVSLYDQYYWDVSKQSSFERMVKSLHFGDEMKGGYTELLFDRDTSGPQSIFGPTACGA